MVSFFFSPVDTKCVDTLATVSEHHDTTLDWNEWMYFLCTLYMRALFFSLSIDAGSLDSLTDTLL